MKTLLASTSLIACLTLVACGDSGTSSSGGPKKTPAQSLSENWSNKHLKTTDGIINFCFEFQTLPGACTWHRVWSEDSIDGPWTAERCWIDWDGPESRYVSVETSGADNCSEDPCLITIIESKDALSASTIQISDASTNSEGNIETWNVGEGLCDGVVATN